MKEILTYYKNSNTGDIIIVQEFTETTIKEIPVYFYNYDGTERKSADLIGYVKISEKHFNQLAKKLKQIKTINKTVL